VLGVEYLEAVQIYIEYSLNILIIGKIPIYIEVQELGYFLIPESKELDQINPAF
jgi:hypothetical protein